MNKYHQEILAEIKKEATLNKKKSRFDLNNYMGTTHTIYDLTSAQGKEIAKTWIQNHTQLTIDELRELLNSLYQGQSHNERTFGGKLLEKLPKLRKQIEPECIKKWLTGSEGWGEVDSLCQSSFTAKEVLENWGKWEKLLKILVKDPDVHKRRASLVLLTKSVRESDDPKLSGMAFANIDKLKGEKDILITKAVSWLLRSLIEKHPQEVDKYLKDNKDTLPKIALRETSMKLLTGKK